MIKYAQGRYEQFVRKTKTALRSLLFSMADRHSRLDSQHDQFSSEEFAQFKVSDENFQKKVFADFWFVFGQNRIPDEVKSELGFSHFGPRNSGSN